MDKLEQQFQRIKDQLAIADQEKRAYFGPCEKCSSYQPTNHSSQHTDLCTNPLLLDWKFNKETGEIEGSRLSVFMARSGLCGENGEFFTPLRLGQRIRKKLPKVIDWAAIIAILTLGIFFFVVFPWLILR